jgi:hypothetical protein
MGHREKGRLRESISNWADNSQQDAREMRATYADASCISIGEAPDREMVRLRGTLRSVTLNPRGGVPALEAELYDGTGTVTVIWLGRRRIAGIAPGSSVQVEGRVGVQHHQRVIYNPRYELRP